MHFHRVGIEVFDEHITGCGGGRSAACVLVCMRGNMGTNVEEVQVVAVGMWMLS